MPHTKRVRFLEIVPGAATWFSFVAPLVLSFFLPFAVAIYILLFDLFWLYKAVIMGWHLIVGYRQMRRDMRTDWIGRLEHLAKEDLNKNWRQLYHVVILATYREPLEMLEQSIDSIATADYPNERIIFVLATEGRDQENARRNGQALTQKFGHKFAHFLVSEHPADIAGEMKAKGANVTWAAKKLSQLIAKQKINPAQVIVSTADADTRFNKSYFANLSYLFLTVANPIQSAFQPIPLFSNNIWHASAIPRVLAFGSTFWQLIESTRPWRLITFSTHAMSLKTLQEIDYWDVTVVNEDSRQYWRGYFHYDGDFTVIPINLPVYMDAVLASNWWETYVHQYQQRLRWAYGIEHFPFVTLEMARHPKIPLGNRLIKWYRLFEANYSWATASVYIAIVSWLPILLNPNFAHSVLGSNIQYYAARILTLTWIGIVTSAWVSLNLLPPRPPGMHRLSKATMVLQWILAPVSAIIFGSLPAIQAQTKLMLGQYMGFWTTKKIAVKTDATG